MTQRLGIALAIALGTVACAPVGDSYGLDFPVDADANGKTDVFGRKLAGIASDYEASDLDESVLVKDHKRRRQVAWSTIEKVLTDVPLLGLVESAGEHEEIELPEGEVPKVPRFQTWYGVDDLKRMFQRLYDGLGPSDRTVRKPFTAAAIDDAVKWNAQALDRSKRWPFERYLKYVRELGLCPDEMPDDECAQLVQNKVSGVVGGSARILYSPATTDHILRNYSTILGCLDQLKNLTMAALPSQETNFTFCFGSEFPTNGVLVKAQWARADFGKEVPVFNTDADTLTRQLAGTAHWGDEGDRKADPSPDKIFTIRLRNGDKYRLVGLHIMTKELRHWQWITMWWSDKPKTDFGADRPAAFSDRLAGVWSNYKMCVVDGFKEEDPDGAGRFGDMPSLAAVLRAVDTGVGGPTWCSNPYMEHGRNNARTNCIGCHQHGGATIMPDRDNDGAADKFDLEALINDNEHFPETGRTQIRDVFPADYLYSFNHVDDFAQMIKTEVNFYDGADRDLVRARIDRVLGMTGDVDAGRLQFAETCATCHGATGEGTSFAPNLFTRVPSRDGESLVQTLIQGRGQMPAWGDQFADQRLADLYAYLRDNFGGDE